MRPSVFAIGAGLVATVLLAACGGDSGSSSSSSSSSAAAAVCQSRTQIQTAVNDMRGVTLDTATVGQLKSDLAAISGALTSMRSAAGVLSQARLDDFRTAVGALQDTLQTPVPTGTPLTDVRAAVSAQVAAIGAALSALFQSVPC